METLCKTGAWFACIKISRWSNRKPATHSEAKVAEQCVAIQAGVSRNIWFVFRYQGQSVQSVREYNFKKFLHVKVIMWNLKVVITENQNLAQRKW